VSDWFAKGDKKSNEQYGYTGGLVIAAATILVLYLKRRRKRKMLP
jgi:hypothetical protein